MRAPGWGGCHWDFSRRETIDAWSSSARPDTDLELMPWCPAAKLLPFVWSTRRTSTARKSARSHSYTQQATQQAPRGRGAWKKLGVLVIGTPPGATLAFAFTLAGQHHCRCAGSSTFGPKRLSGSVLDPAFRVIGRAPQAGLPEGFALFFLPSFVSRHPEDPGLPDGNFHERLDGEIPFKNFTV
jgi:hypothetical protein